MGAEYDKEMQRVRSVYVKRLSSASGKRLYHWSAPDNLYVEFRRDLAWAWALSAGGIDLGSARLLDVGCGSGRWLQKIIGWGAAPRNVHGVDLMEDNIARAQELLPQGAALTQSDGNPLPFEDGSMDLVAASTVFSSILDPEARGTLAEEMVRMTRPGGILCIFDMAVSDPRNPATTGIGPGEIRRIFCGAGPGAKLQGMRRILFPIPLLRRLPVWAYGLAMSLEMIPFLCTHAMYLLRKD